MFRRVLIIIMKTIEEFIKEIEGSEALQKELEAIKDKDAFEELLKKYDVNADTEEFVKALKALTEGEITDDAVEAAAAGSGWDVDSVDPIAMYERMKERVFQVFGRKINGDFGD